MRRITNFLVMLMLLTLCTSKIELNDYIDVSSSGFNGTGVIDYEVDLMRLSKDVLKTESNPTELEEFEQLKEYKIEVNKENNLSNGDEVIFKITPDEENKYVKESEFKYIVEGLEDSKMISLDELESELTYEFNGFSGSGIVHVFISDKYPIYLYDLRVNPNEFLSNGDEITVSLTKEAIERLLIEGYTLESNEVKYVVSELEENE